MCTGEPPPTQTWGSASSERSTSTVRTAVSGNGATEPGSNPVAATTSAGVGDPRPPGRDGARHLARIPAAVAGDEREHGTALGDEDERLDDAARRAPDRVGGVLRGRHGAL